MSEKYQVVDGYTGSVYTTHETLTDALLGSLEAKNKQRRSASMIGARAYVEIRLAGELVTGEQCAAEARKVGIINW